MIRKASALATRGNATATRAAPEALRAALAAIDPAVQRWSAPPLVAARARGLVQGYHARWAAGGWQVIEVHPAFEVPIRNPATGRRSRTFRLAGQCEALLARGGRRYLLECKTAGEPIDAAGAPFWRRLLIDGRSGDYALALRHEGRPVGGTLFDVIRRPAIRPRAIPKGGGRAADGPPAGTLAEIRGRGTYFGRLLSDGQLREVLAGDGHETPDLLAVRLAADAVARPEWYFQRRLVHFSREQLAACAADLWHTADEIRRCQNSGRHYRDSDACMRYGVPCPYLPICSGRERADSDRYRARRRIHPELVGHLAACDERDVLTHSRVQCFRLCRRKHYFLYGLGIEPVRPPQSESLLLGRLMRQALAAWWRLAGAGM